PRGMNGRGALSINLFRRKRLGFTDNRQDAALQAGHFNDFVFVTRLRAAILLASHAPAPSVLRPLIRLKPLLGMQARPNGGKNGHSLSTEWPNTPALSSRRAEGHRPR